jgi:hypothetical protein
MVVISTVVSQQGKSQDHDNKLVSGNAENEAEQTVSEPHHPSIDSAPWGFHQMFLAWKQKEALISRALLDGEHNAVRYS